MFRLLTAIFSIVSIFSFGQSSVSPKRNERSIVYAQAITEYLKAFHKTSNVRLDTLFVGQYDDLKNIQLPSKIENTKIILLKAEGEADKILKHCKLFAYVNIAELKLTKENASFAFVMFFVERSKNKINWWPKHNCFIDLKYDPKSKSFKLDKQRFEYPYANSRK